MDWLKKIYNSFWAKDKKIANLSIVFIAGVIILIAGGSFFEGNDKKQSLNIEKQDSETKEHTGIKDYEENLEKRLQSILSQIEGVGSASVMITFHSGTELIPASDVNEKQSVTEEKDDNGGSRTITQSERENKILIMGSQSTLQKPLLLKEIKPQVKGAVIVAEGASQIKVKSDIKEAVVAALGVSAHNVQVFKKKQ